MRKHLTCKNVKKIIIKDEIASQHFYTHLIKTKSHCSMKVPHQPQPKQLKTDINSVFIARQKGQKRKLHNIVWLDYPLAYSRNHLATTWSKLQNRALQTVDLSLHQWCIWTSQKEHKVLISTPSNGEPGRLNWSAWLLKLQPRYTADFLTSAHLQQYHKRVDRMASLFFLFEGVFVTK